MILVLVLASPRQIFRNVVELTKWRVVSVVSKVRMEMPIKVSGRQSQFTNFGRLGVAKEPRHHKSWPMLESRLQSSE